MEKLLAYAFLLFREFISEERFAGVLHETFLADPKNELLLELECETAENAAAALMARYDYGTLDPERFGKILLAELEKCYNRCGDIKNFCVKLFYLRESLPGCVSEREPFPVFAYEDEPLYYDEGELRKILEKAFRHYG